MTFYLVLGWWCRGILIPLQSKQRRSRDKKRTEITTTIFRTTGADEVEVESTMCVHLPHVACRPSDCGTERRVKCIKSEAILGAQRKVNKSMKVAGCMDGFLAFALRRRSLVDRGALYSLPSSLRCQ
ncbi:hypothetical protein J6590_059689 [Homalodisca vitripennis]|nr:hypothetical protein J6590_059689 [Homalodisca vitripennis]